MESRKAEPGEKAAPKRDLECALGTGNAVPSSSKSSEFVNGINGELNSKKPKTEKDSVDPLSKYDFGLSINPGYCLTDFKNQVRIRFKTYGERFLDLKCIGFLVGAVVESCFADSDLLTPRDDTIDPLRNIVFRQPFRHMIFDHFFTGSLAGLEDELLSTRFLPLHKDLFQLSQTKELSNPEVLEFSWLAQFFRTEMRQWISDITGITLGEEVDMRGAMYRYTDFLMCHDDKLTTRKIAYVYYLTDSEWAEEDGGTLDLFDSVCVDDTAVPAEVRKRIVPKRNSLVLFAVNDDSFHQVKEVLNPRKSRLSLTGWFHLPEAVALRPEFQDAPSLVPIQFHEATADHARICMLAKPDDAQSVRNKLTWRKEFIKDQFITLPSLLSTNFYNGLVKELQSNDRTIEWKTPVNRNQAGHYKYLDVRQGMPRLLHLSLLVRTMVTDQFLQSVTDITSVDMNANLCNQADSVVRESPSKSRSRSSSSPQQTSWHINSVQFRLERFAHGDYTLRTYDAVQQDSVLDMFFHIDCDRLERDCGGGLMFVESDEDDEWDVIAKISGRSNAISLVKRENGVVFCTEYVNHRWERRNGGRPFYRLWLSLPAVEMPGELQAGSSSSSSAASGDNESEADSSGLGEDQDIPAQVSGESDEEE